LSEERWVSSELTEMLFFCFTIHYHFSLFSMGR
jgi:hypothetical protein